MKIGVVSIVVVLMLSFTIFSMAEAEACDFGEGHQKFTYQIDEQEYVVRAGEMKKGEKISFISYGDMMDVFIFNQEQYFSYIEVGKESMGWKGAALFKDLGVVSSKTVFTAPDDGIYYYVIDNTIAGIDAGEGQKVIQHDSIFPFAPESRGPFPLYFPAVIAGLVLFTLGLMAYYSNEKKKNGQ
ncbi:MAG: hypothetical protein QW520_06215 [Methanomassiliicoccales archaeon]